MSLYRVIRNPDTNEKDLEVIGGTTVQPGCPVGTILAYYGSVVPTGYLPCNGTTFDETQFPNLYLLLGTNVLPDLRECTLVGIGENTSDTIGNHDIYTIGEFKDDQVQVHTHKVNSYTYAPSSATRRSWYSDAGAQGGNDVYTGNPITGRYGAVTRGKSKGVNYIIKAVSNVAESEATAVFDQLKTYVESYLVAKESYSTTEIKTDATWIDGKPIYRKVFYTDSWVDNSTYDVSDLDIDEVASLKAMWCRSDAWFEAPYASSGSFYSSVYYSPSTNKINFSTSNTHAGAKNRTIIEYTKTTD